MEKKTHKGSRRAKGRGPIQTSKTILVLTTARVALEVVLKPPSLFSDLQGQISTSALRRL